jgi:hypothetical protein
LSELDTSADIHDFVKGVIILNGNSMPAPEFEYDISLRPDDIRANRLDGTNPASVFHKTLPALMKMQETSHPLLDVPVVLEELIKAIHKHGGLAQVGLFRQTPKQELLDTARNALDTGKSVQSLEFPDPNVPASLLKAWLRDLEEPVVPMTMYTRAILLAQKLEYSDEEVKRFLSAMPDINKKVVEHLADLLGEVSKDPRTQMTITSLGVVFAPSFMRNPSGDALEILSNSKFEARFVAMLLASVLEQEEVWRAVVAKAQAADDAKRQQAALKAVDEQVHVPLVVSPSVAQHH